MPMPADPMFVFHRIRTEVQRLMYLENMQDKTKQFMHVLDTMQPRYAEAYDKHIIAVKQALIAPKAKKIKLSKQEEHSISVGWANYMRGYPREESEHEPFMLQGWDAAQTKYPVQPHTGLTKEEQPNDPVT